MMGVMHLVQKSRGVSIIYYSLSKRITPYKLGQETKRVKKAKVYTK